MLQRHIVNTWPLSTKNLATRSILGKLFISLLYTVEDFPVPTCQFPIFRLDCALGPADFNSQENSFDLGLRALKVGGHSDFVITSISLVQLLPESQVNCWLNLSDLPADQLYSEPLGIIVRRTETVNITLDCTEFEPSDVKEGVWTFETETYELKEGELSPAKPAGDMLESDIWKPQGYVRKNYYACGPDGSEWCNCGLFKDKCE